MNVKTCCRAMWENIGTGIWFDNEELKFRVKDGDAIHYCPFCGEKIIYDERK